MVIRYDFLWKEDEKAGHVEGRKDRPCLILGVWDCPASVGLVPVKRGQLIFGQMHSKLGAQAYEQVREHVRNRTLENVRREPDPYLQEVLGKKRKSQKPDVKKYLNTEKKKCCKS